MAAQMTIKQLLDLGLAHHRAGNLAEAQRAYETILKHIPHHADALHLLGLIEYQQGNANAAIARIQKALQHRPDFPEALGNLGLMLAGYSLGLILIGEATQ